MKNKTNKSLELHNGFIHTLVLPPYLYIDVKRNKTTTSKLQQTLTSHTAVFVLAAYNS